MAGVVYSLEITVHCVTVFKDVHTGTEWSPTPDLTPLMEKYDAKASEEEPKRVGSVPRRVVVYCPCYTWPSHHS